MGFLADLKLGTPANPANRANPEQEKRLLRTAGDLGIDPGLAARLCDPSALEALSDSECRFHLRALHLRYLRHRGQVPDGWTEVVRCRGCGPVYLWPGCPAEVVACPWCSNRKSGRSVPAARVFCWGCKHHLPNPHTPEAGRGLCAASDASHWPMELHACAHWRPA